MFSPDGIAVERVACIGVTWAMREGKARSTMIRSAVRGAVLALLLCAAASVVSASPGKALLDAPPNDDLAHAISISDLPFSDTQNTAEATDEPSEVPAGCAPQGVSEKAVWYRFDAKGNHAVVFDTDGSTAGDEELDTVMSIWLGDGTHPLTQLDCVDSPLVGESLARIVLAPTPGVTYFIKVGGSNGAVGDVVFSARLAPSGPPNDDLAQAFVIDSLPYIDAQMTTYATDEPDEVRASCAVDEGTERGIWYSWTPEAADTVVFDTIGSRVDLGGGVIDQMDTVLSVWTGGPGHPLDEVACSDDVGDTLWSRVTLSGEAGVTYYVKVAGSFGETGEAVLNARSATPAPPNDDLANATRVASVPFEDEEVTVSATTEPNELRASCGPLDVRERSVWYRFTAPARAEYAFDTMGSGYDTVLSLWNDRSEHPLSEISCNDDLEDSTSARLELELDAGDTVLARVSAARGQGGPLSFAIDVAPQRPANDDLVDAIEVTAPDFISHQDTRAATDEPNEVRASCPPASYAPEAGVWYKVGPDASGSFAFTTDGSDFDTVLSVWTGGPSHPLVEVACNDDYAGNSWSTVTFDAVSGETYYIKASGAEGERGQLTFASVSRQSLVFIPVALR